MTSEISLNQISRGLFTIVAVFFLLLTAEKLSLVSPLIPDSKGVKTSIVVPSSQPIQTNQPPANVIIGRFSPADEGKIRIDESDPSVTYYYKMIRLESSRVRGKQISLKLETTSNNLLSWKEAREVNFELENNLLYFLYSIEQDGNIIYSENFTGNYQVILN